MNGEDEPLAMGTIPDEMKRPRTGTVADLFPRDDSPVRGHAIFVASSRWGQPRVEQAEYDITRAARVDARQTLVDVKLRVVPGFADKHNDIQTQAGIALMAASSLRQTLGQIYLATVALSMVDFQRTCLVTWMDTANAIFDCFAVEQRAFNVAHAWIKRREEMLLPLAPQNLKQRFGRGIQLPYPILVEVIHANFSALLGRG